MSPVSYSLEEVLVVYGVLNELQSNIGVNIATLDGKEQPRDAGYRKQQSICIAF